MAKAKKARQTPARARPVKQTKNRPKRRGHRTRTTWRPGICPNPAGRPRSGHAFAEVLREYLEDRHGRSGVSRKWHLVDRLYRLAVAKDASVSAGRLLLERAMDLDLEQRVKELEEQLARVLKLVRGAAA